MAIKAKNPEFASVYLSLPLMLTGVIPFTAVKTQK
jgi:hypothetical protein